MGRPPTRNDFHLGVFHGLREKTATGKVQSQYSSLAAVAETAFKRVSNGLGETVGERIIPALRVVERSIILKKNNFMLECKMPECMFPPLNEITFGSYCFFFQEVFE